MGYQLAEQDDKDRGDYEGQEGTDGKEVVEAEGKPFGDGDIGEDEGREEPVGVPADSEDGGGLGSVYGVSEFRCFCWDQEIMC